MLINRLIELGKLQIRTEQRDKREYMSIPAVKKVKNKSGIVEMRPITCAECSEEYCNGRTCIDFNYDLYTRIIPKETAKIIATKATESGGLKKAKRSKRKLNLLDLRKKKRDHSKSPNKSKRR